MASVAVAPPSPSSLDAKTAGDGQEPRADVPIVEANREATRENLGPPAPQNGPSNSPTRRDAQDLRRSHSRDHRAERGEPRLAERGPGVAWHAMDAATAEGRKIFIAGLPEDTSQADLNDCFGQVGQILSCELKKGYGFVEFGTGQDAANAVAKYDQGTFLGEQIKVEISHGQGSRFKKDGEPPKLITCFNCKGEGHYAKYCPNSRDGPPPRGPPTRGRDSDHRSGGDLRTSRNGDYHDRRPPYDGPRPPYDNARPPYEASRPPYASDRGGPLPPRAASYNDRTAPLPPRAASGPAPYAAAPPAPYSGGRPPYSSRDPDPRDRRGPPPIQTGAPIPSSYYPPYDSRDRDRRGPLPPAGAVPEYPPYAYAGSPYGYPPAVDPRYPYGPPPVRRDDYYPPGPDPYYTARGAPPPSPYDYPPPGVVARSPYPPFDDRAPVPYSGGPRRSPPPSARAPPRQDSRAAPYPSPAGRYNDDRRGDKPGPARRRSLSPPARRNGSAPYPAQARPPANGEYNNAPPRDAPPYAGRP